MQPSTEAGAGGLEERIEALCAWVGEIADRVRATELATGDEKTAKELRRALEAVAKHDPRLESRLTDRTDVLADRVGTLASAVSTTSSELARRDGEIAALRRELDRGGAQIQALEKEIAGGAPAAEIEKLRKAVAALSVEHSPRMAEEQAVRLGGKVDYLTERVDTLAKTVAATAAGLAGRDGDLATLRQRLDERTKRLEQGLVDLEQPPEAGLGRRLDVLEAEVQQSIASLAKQDEANEALRQALATSLDAHAASQSSKFAGLAARLDAVATDVESTSTGLAEKHAAVERRLAEALSGSAREAARTGELERRLAELTGRQETAERALAGARDELAAEVGRASTAAAEQLSGLAERLERVELLRMADASETARVSAEWASKLEEFVAHEAQLRTIADSVAQAARRTETAGPALADLEERLHAVEQAGVDAQDEVARMSASWTAELERIATKVDDASVSTSAATSRGAQAELLTELNARLDTIVHDRQAVAAQIAQASENEVADLRVLIDGFRTRLAPIDLESPGPTYVGGRLDELARRLDSIEGVGSEREPESGPGEGRLRLELRALELRAERAELVARRDRDAMAAQLDRLAGQIESRFQELESDPTDSPYSEGARQGEVVPLRGAEV